MKKAIVKGCAGFIGSSLSQRLLQEGYQVMGVDCFSNHYDPKIKQDHVKELALHSGFSLIEKNILDLDWKDLLTGVDYVFHQAAIPGVRSSWGESFQDYSKMNILATQLILEAAKNSDIKKLVYASSSSIYGKTEGSTSETTIARPLSPYGVTKLAAEQLCHLYADNYGVPTISLRYFTVYGPKQRPDMAFHKFIRAVLRNEAIQVYGDGTQSRDFTYVEDVVEANLQAAQADAAGIAVNIGGKSRIVLNDVIDLIGKLCNRIPHVDYMDKQAGDPPHTWADIRLAESVLGYSPKVSLEEGLKREIKYIKGLYR